MTKSISKRATSDSASVAKERKTRKALRTKNDGPSGWSKFLTWLQELGKALQFPIAVLPFAAILNRFGALGVSYTFNAETNEITNAVGYWISFIIQQPGKVVFDNLALIFAIGVAFGFASDHRGEVALVGGVFFLVLLAMTMEHSLPEMMYGNVLTFDYTDAEGAHTVSRLFYVPTAGADGGDATGAVYVLNVGVLGGIVSGVISAVLYNRFKDIKLPTIISFFGGRRFVPMAALVISVPTAIVFAALWPWIQYGLMQFGQLVADPNNPAMAIPGTAIYAILNRLLLPFGLHQILNTFFWFQLPIHGEIIQGISGAVIGPDTWINGDINAFARGIAGSGLFQSGFFPIMMGGIPAIAFAMIYSAKRENRKQVSGFLGGVAIVALISGITEPIEYSFVFLSPLLLVAHALITGLFMAITTGMRIQVGFGFSAGLIDYIISFVQSWGFAMHNENVAFQVTANPLWILVLSLAAGGMYFGIFSYVIKKMNVATPGREEILPKPPVPTDAKDAKDKDAKDKGKDAKDKDSKSKDAKDKGKDVKEKDSKDKDSKSKTAKSKTAKTKDAKKKTASAKKAKSSKSTKAKDAKAKDAKIKKTAASKATGSRASDVTITDQDGKKIVKTKKTIKVKTGADKYETMAIEIIAAIGEDNFVSVDNCATRLRLILKDNNTVDDDKIKAAGAFGVRRLGSEAFQIVIGTDVEHVANAIKIKLKK